MQQCKECEYLGDYTSGAFIRNPHYCCELIWNLIHEDYRVDPNKIDQHCPKKNKKLINAICEIKTDLNGDEEINKEKMSEIENYLLDAYIGARAMDDLETQVRIARAIGAFKADIDIDIFTEEFMEKYYSQLGD